MKKLILGLIVTLLTYGCSSDDNETIECYLKVTNLSYDETFPRFVITTSVWNINQTLLVRDWGYYIQGECFNPYSKETTISNFPYQEINNELNLSLPIYAPLLCQGNYKIIEDILLVNNGYDIKVYSLINPNNFNTLLLLQNNKLVCQYTGLEYLLYTGETLNRDGKYLKEYKTTRIENILTIIN
jgi:hypothetical protein